MARSLSRSVTGCPGPHATPEPRTEPAPRPLRHRAGQESSPFRRGRPAHRAAAPRGAGSKTCRCGPALAGATEEVADFLIASTSVHLNNAATSCSQDWLPTIVSADQRGPLKLADMRADGIVLMAVVFLRDLIVPETAASVQQLPCC